MYASIDGGPHALVCQMFGVHHTEHLQEVMRVAMTTHRIVLSVGEHEA